MTAEAMGGATLAAAQAHVHRVVTASRTSFLMGMKILPRDRREAMFAVYAFCREVDDIADEGGTPAEKRARLAEWRNEIDRLYAGRPLRPTAQALAGPVARFDLPRAEFLALIDGMEMDARETVRLTDMDTLRLYCRRVAGAVGMLSIRVFGATEPAARDLAVALGEALQLTNILRDLGEDAARDRIYLPADLLARHGIAMRGDGSDPPAMLAHPGLAGACAEVAEVARHRFDEADAALAQCDRRRLRPALLMAGVYDRYLRLLTRRGWQRAAEPVRLSKPAKVWAAIRLGLLRPAR